MNDDPRLAVLGVFTPEGELTPGYGDHYLFMVGRDDCHGILHYLVPRETLSFKLNMFGYDDDELNSDILGLIAKPSVHVQISLDRSQAGGVHEKRILDLDRQLDSEAFAESVCRSATPRAAYAWGRVSGLRGR
jgi:hypothetical protein